MHMNSDSDHRAAFRGRRVSIPAGLFLALVLALASAAAPPAAAPASGSATVPPDDGLALAVGARIGTAGAGGQLTLGLVERLNFRFVGQFGTFSYDDSVDEVDYELDFKFSNMGALFDFHPTGGEFRLSLGIFHNGNELSGEGRPTEDMDIGNVNFTPTQIGTLYADMDFASVAGYVGIGFGNAVRGDRRWTVSLDLGVMFYDTPEFSLTADGTLSGTRFFQAQLRKEEQDIEDDFISQAKFWPVLALGIDVRF